MRIFILDDEIETSRSQLAKILSKHELTLAKTVNEGVLKFKGPYDLLLLDHDLGLGKDNVGTKFVEALLLMVNSKGPKPSVVLHSQNPVGRKAMRLLLEDKNWHAVEFGYGEKYLKFLGDNFCE